MKTLMRVEAAMSLVFLAIVSGCGGDAFQHRNRIVAKIGNLRRDDAARHVVIQHLFRIKGHMGGTIVAGNAVNLIEMLFIHF